MKKRPDTVPKSAWWSEKDNEWLDGERNPAGELHGLIRYYRPEGLLVCETEFEHGVAHGSFVRYHQTGEASRRGSFERGVLEGEDISFRANGETTEQCFPHARVSDSVVRYMQRWQEGKVVDYAFFDAQDRRVFPWGQALPEGPGRLEIGRSKVRWGVLTEGKKEGLWITYDHDGTFLHEETYDSGVATHRLRPVKEHEVAGVTFESGSCDSNHWSGDITLLDEQRRPIRTFDPTGASAVTEPLLRDLLERVAQVSWGDLESAYGNRVVVGRYLATVAAGTTEDDRHDALSTLYGFICHQGSTYEASAAAIPFLVEMAALESDSSWRNRMLGLVQDMSVVSQRTFRECQNEGYRDVLDCVASLIESVPKLLGLAAERPESRVAVIRCLAAAFDDSNTIDWLNSRLTDAAPIVRAASLVALGNVNGLRPEAVASAIGSAEPLDRVAAAYALALAQKTKAPDEAIEALIAALVLRIGSPFRVFVYG